MALTKNNTCILIENGITSVILHSTRIVEFDANQIRLNTGGWKTATTKARMNEVAEEFKLGYTVRQKAGVWYVDYNGASQKMEEDTLVMIR